jgi:hypothetical protein
MKEVSERQPDEGREIRAGNYMGKAGESRDR